MDCEPRLGDLWVLGESEPWEMDALLGTVFVSRFCGIGVLSGILAPHLHA